MIIDCMVADNRGTILCPAKAKIGDFTCLVNLGELPLFLKQISLTNQIKLVTEGKTYCGFVVKIIHELNSFVLVLSNNTREEKRSSLRVDVKGVLSLQINDDVVREEVGLVNMSNGGMAFASRKDFPLGTVVSFTFNHSTNVLIKPFLVSGKIIRSDKKEDVSIYAVSFNRLSDLHQAILSHYVAKIVSDSIS